MVYGANHPPKIIRFCLQLMLLEQIRYEWIGNSLRSVNPADVKLAVVMETASEQGPGNDFFTGGAEIV